jgi:hypothetical protein
MMKYLAASTPFFSFTLARTFSVVKHCLSLFYFPFSGVLVAFKRTAWLTAGAICGGPESKKCIHDQGRLPKRQNFTAHALLISPKKIVPEHSIVEPLTSRWPNVS